MIVSYIPKLPGGRPVISSGVERELQHAFEGTKEVYVIWQPECEPSPFVTETATAVFRSVDELFDVVTIRNRFVWPNGDRPCRINSITTDAGELRIGIEPL